MTAPAVGLPTATATATGSSRLGRWLFAPVPLSRAAAFRTVVYLFVMLDAVFWSNTTKAKADISTQLYVPLRIARILWFMPEPTHAVVTGTFWGLVILGPLAAFGRFPRVLGIAVFLLYLEWMLVAMSYGKVDHDRFGILIALALLPTIGRARHGDATPSEAAGWVFRMVQLAVVATYFLAAWAKLRFGGVKWMWSNTLAWAVSRRGTMFSKWLLNYPLILQLTQVGMIAFEALSPLIFWAKEKTQHKVVAGLYLFHLITALSLTITFTPHLVAMLAFLPLEKVTPIEWARRLVARPAAAAAAAAAGAASVGVGLDGVALGLREGALGGAAGHAVAVAGDPAVDGPGDPQDGSAAQ